MIAIGSLCVLCLPFCRSPRWLRAPKHASLMDSRQTGETGPHVVYDFRYSDTRFWWSRRACRYNLWLGTSDAISNDDSSFFFLPLCCQWISNDYWHFFFFFRHPSTVPSLRQTFFIGQLRFICTHHFSPSSNPCWCLILTSKLLLSQYFFLPHPSTNLN